MSVEWTLVRESFTRPYRVTVSMVVLVSLVPLYLFIADRARHGNPRAPEIALDRLIPVQPVWSLIYGAVYFFLILLPILAVRQEEHIRRTVRAYLMVWLVAYAIFLVYPTYAPRGDEVEGTGFAAWGLRGLYGSDPPFNCFPSLHVAHSFVSALTCWRLHRRLGIVTLVSAAIVGLSTLFTKQHYVLDVIAGAALAYVAYLIFLRGYPRERVPELDQRVAPMLATVIAAAILTGVLALWVAYELLR